VEKGRFATTQHQSRKRYGNPGDFIPGSGGEEYTAAQLGFTEYNLTQTFYVEAVRPSTTVADQQIKVEVDWDGEGTEWVATDDAVRVTAYQIRFLNADDSVMQLDDFIGLAGAGLLKTIAGYDDGDYGSGYIHFADVPKPYSTELVFSGPLSETQPDTLNVVLRSTRTEDTVTADVTETGDNTLTFTRVDPAVTINIFDYTYLLGTEVDDFEIEAECASLSQEPQVFWAYETDKNTLCFRSQRTALYLDFGSALDPDVACFYQRLRFFSRRIASNYSHQGVTALLRSRRTRV